MWGLFDVEHDRIRWGKNDFKGFVLNNWEGVSGTSFERTISCKAFGHFKFQVSAGPPSKNTEKELDVQIWSLGEELGTPLNGTIN